MKAVLILALCIGVISSSLANPLKSGPLFNQNQQQSLLSAPSKKLSPQCSNYAQSSPPSTVGDDDYILSWKWASKQTGGAIQGNIYWNDLLIANLTVGRGGPIYSLKYKVKGRHGVNTLRIKVQGWISGVGFEIDDITLVQKGKKHNYVVNGDFQSPKVDTFNIFTNITGWTSAPGSSFEVGYYPIGFNPLWKSQIAELQMVSGMNSNIYQNITLNVPSDAYRQYLKSKQEYQSQETLSSTYNN